MHLIDTHCHLNLMTKKTFDIPLSVEEINTTQEIINTASTKLVTKIINVGTSIIESENCIALAKKYSSVSAVVGIHPTDCTATWKKDFEQIKKWAQEKEQHKVVGIGECGLDFYHKPYDLERQKDAFKAHIELALHHDLALIVHSRNAYDETLHVLEEYKNDAIKGIMHCFSYDLAFAQTVHAWNFVLGIGGAITYPKNQQLRDVVLGMPLSSFILETDAPFLPIQSMRGKQNHPQYIYDIALYIAQLLGISCDEVASQTSKTSERIFGLSNI